MTTAVNISPFILVIMIIIIPVIQLCFLSDTPEYVYDNEGNIIDSSGSGLYDPNNENSAPLIKRNPHEYPQADIFNKIILSVPIILIIGGLILIVLKLIRKTN